VNEPEEEARDEPAGMGDETRVNLSREGSLGVRALTSLKDEVHGRGVRKFKSDVISLWW
jgi:hypothetical protein